MLGRNKYGQGTQKLEDAAGGNSLKDMEEEVSRLWPTHSPAHRGSDGTQAVGSWHCNSV